MTNQNERTVRRLVSEAWTGKNLAIIDELVSDKYVEYAPFGELHGIKDYREGVRMFTSAFPDIQIHIEDLVVKGDTVAFRVDVTGTHRGPFMDVPASGNKVRFTGMDFTRFKDGKVVEEWFLMDMMGVLAQLQAEPAKAAKAPADKTTKAPKAAPITPGR